MAAFLIGKNMFGQLTSLTGGGGLQSSSSSSADGDNTFANDFNYKSGGSQSSNNQLMTFAVIGLVVFLALKGKK